MTTHKAARQNHRYAMDCAPANPSFVCGVAVSHAKKMNAYAAYAPRGVATRAAHMCTFRIIVFVFVGPIVQCKDQIVVPGQKVQMPSIPAAEPSRSQPSSWD